MSNIGVPCVLASLGVRSAEPWHVAGRLFGQAPSRADPAAARPRARGPAAAGAAAALPRLRSHLPDAARLRAPPELVPPAAAVRRARRRVGAVGLRDVTSRIRAVEDRREPVVSAARPF